MLPKKLLSAKMLKNSVFLSSFQENMQKSKMIEMLSHLSPKELSRFGDYLASPFFNKDSELPAFYNYIKKYAPEFDSRNLEKEKLLAKAIPGVNLTEKRLGYIMSDIVEHIEGFIKYNKCQAEDVDGARYLLNTFNKWETDKFFEQTLREVKETLKNYPYRNADFFFKEYLIETEVNSYFDRQKKRAYDESLQKAANHLDLFYIATKLKYSCELINRQKLINADYTLPMLKEITQHLQENPYEDYPSISIYHQILMTFLENDVPGHFNKLISLLDEHSFKFPPAEAKDMYAYAQNYCIVKINAGETRYATDLFAIYKTCINRELLLVDGFISPWAFKNIVWVALRVGEVEWTDNFIKTYSKKINPKFRDNAYNYNYACLLFFQDKFGEALRLLNQVEFTDIFYGLSSRTMQIKIYYELDEYDPLQSAIEAFKIFLRRNKTLSENFKITYNNFLKFTDKLSRTNRKDKVKLDELQQKIEDTKVVADINWLLQKVEEKR